MIHSEFNCTNYQFRDSIRSYGYDIVPNIINRNFTDEELMKIHVTLYCMNYGELFVYWDAIEIRIDGLIKYFEKKKSMLHDVEFGGVQHIAILTTYLQTLTECRNKCSMFNMRSILVTQNDYINNPYENWIKCMDKPIEMNKDYSRAITNLSLYTTDNLIGMNTDIFFIEGLLKFIRINPRKFSHIKPSFREITISKIESLLQNLKRNFNNKYRIFIQYHIDVAEAVQENFINELTRPKRRRLNNDK